MSAVFDGVLEPLRLVRFTDWVLYIFLVPGAAEFERAWSAQKSPSSVIDRGTRELLDKRKNRISSQQGVIYLPFKGKSIIFFIKEPIIFIKERIKWVSDQTRWFTVFGMSFRGPHSPNLHG